jgi:hypothetical protein
VITEKTIMMLAAETGLDVRTVRRVVLEGGAPRSKTTRTVLGRALIALNLKPLAAKLEKEGRIPQTFIAEWQTKHAPKETRS